MTLKADTSEDAGTAAEQRDALVEELVATGRITSAAVERAFRTVPRHLFMPAGTPLEAAYAVDRSVVVKRGPDGTALSSVSAAYIQARMIEQAGLGPGMSVLEIGAGGLNAALLAEVVGPAGRVVSVDIDPEVVDRAHRLLAATGYADRVTVLRADAEYPVPELGGRVDAVVVTVGAWEVAPAWLEQLAEGGRLVVPLRLNGVTRTIGFARDGDHLASTSAVVAGFVPMQGAGAHDGRIVVLTDGQGCQVTLTFDTEPPGKVGRLEGVLTTAQATVWSGVTIGNQVSFADLHLWFACFLPGFCRLAVDDGTDLAAGHRRWFPFGTVRGGSVAYLVVRPAVDGAGAEFGACAYGPHGERVATGVVEQIRAWDRQARHAAAPTFAYWPAGSSRPPADANTAVLAKKRGEVTVSWPTTLCPP
ncbi:methyltransferase, FxLD system [Protofrankia symbiont of Coriaria ruscifolia]|uniref:methyltransferase, FxLD system n=1 Tax=Protofrankia symbiont of Coriaria ruscifolia TaxID=1306542 RepID=UPI0010411335|nr:methyltransferase, FxLD system [Protofrankia symbiont of Coriaria ruscifolia]